MLFLVIFVNPLPASLAAPQLYIQENKYRVKHICQSYQTTAVQSLPDTMGINTTTSMFVYGHRSIVLFFTIQEAKIPVSGSKMFINTDFIYSAPGAIWYINVPASYSRSPFCF